jgi:hypothetical protein
MRSHDAIGQPREYANCYFMVTAVAGKPLALIVIALVVDRILVLAGVLLFNPVAATAWRRGICRMRPICTFYRTRTTRRKLNLSRMRVIGAAPQDRMREQAEHGELGEHELHRKGR